MSPNDLVEGAVYRVTGWGLKHKYRRIRRFRIIGDMRFVCWTAIDAKNEGSEPESRFADRAIFRVDPETFEALS